MAILAIFRHVANAIYIYNFTNPYFVKEIVKTKLQATLIWNYDPPTHSLNHYGGGVRQRTYFYINQIQDFMSKPRHILCAGNPQSSSPTPHPSSCLHKEFLNLFSYFTESSHFFVWIVFLCTLISLYNLLGSIWLKIENEAVGLQCKSKLRKYLHQRYSSPYCAQDVAHALL